MCSKPKIGLSSICEQYNVPFGATLFTKILLFLSLSFSLTLSQFLPNTGQHPCSPASLSLSLSLSLSQWVRLLRHSLSQLVLLNLSHSSLNCSRLVKDLDLGFLFGLFPQLVGRWVWDLVGESQHTALARRRAAQQHGYGFSHWTDLRFGLISSDRSVIWARLLIF